VTSGFEYWKEEGSHGHNYPVGFKIQDHQERIIKVQKICPF
jgi:hypothetical protein